MVSVTLSFDAELRQWSAWVADIAAYGMGPSPQEAIADLRKALALYGEEVGREQMLQAIAPPMQSLTVPLESLV